jgi:UDP-galactopyranose mutase
VQHDWLVVGAGFTGATLAERLASQLDQRVLVIDRRGHVAGNAFDGPGPDGQPIHHYGAHIFHTVSDRVWDYLSQFTRWRPYEHRVLGSIDGKLIPIPFNLTSLHALIAGPRADAVEDRLLTEIGHGGTIPVLKLLDHADPLLRDLGELVYEKVFANYSAKQWGLRPDQLDRSVTGRVPVVASHDDRYFHDRHQAMPVDGYAAMFNRMLDHPNIDVLLNTDHRDVVDQIGSVRTVFTGPIDEYFDQSYGALPYRSLEFRHQEMPIEYVQPVAVVNYPNEDGFTRILEHKHLTGAVSASTVLTTEWPMDHVPGRNDPYYPVPREENRALHARYLERAADTDPEVVFAGRLADYKYYNMDQAVSRALLVFRELIPVVTRQDAQMSRMARDV